MPHIDTNYRQPLIEIILQGCYLRIPSRIHFIKHEELRNNLDIPEIHLVKCLLTRSTDGFQRQRALRDIIGLSEPWVVPYVILLAGEYVVEIAEELVQALPELDKQLYVNFILENRTLMRTLKAKAASYWNCYYRQKFPVKNSYPALLFLHQLEQWVQEEDQRT